MKLTSKHCIMCRESKLLSEYDVQEDGKLYKVCKECHKKMNDKNNNDRH